MSLLLFSLLAATLPPDIDPAMLPGVESRPAAEIQYAGLAALYPGRVLDTEPRKNDVLNNGRLPKEVELPRNVTYLRIYDLAAALPKISELLAKPALILDLRYVTANANSSEAFAGLLTKAGLASVPVRAVGNLTAPDKLPPPEADAAKPVAPPLVLALVNNETSGPLEAWLAAFQDKESLLAVGTPTAGQPGVYRQADGVTGYYVLDGELLPASGSIAGTGLKPRFLVKTTPEQNYDAYLNFENGATLTSLLRTEHPAAAASPATSGNVTGGNTTTVVPHPAVPDDEEVQDVVLQRAVDVVAALQILGRMPSSTPSGAAQATTAQPVSVSPAPPATTQP